MKGLTNLEAAELGYAPIRVNPKTNKLETVILHHMNKEPGGSLVETWAKTHDLRHAGDRLNARGLTNTKYDPLLNWRTKQPEYAKWYQTEQSVYWRWYKGGYSPPKNALNIPPKINPKLPK